MNESILLLYVLKHRDLYLLLRNLNSKTKDYFTDLVTAGLHGRNSSNRPPQIDRYYGPLIELMVYLYLFDDRKVYMHTLEMRFCYY